MQPIFKEQIQMWADMGYQLPITEGKYWYDNHFICAFKPDGTVVKLYKYKVFDDLSIEITQYKDNKMRFLDTEFEMWDDTVKRLTPELNKYEQEAGRVIKEAISKYADHEKVVMTSTGKDSMVTLDIVKRYIPDVRIIFNNTSMDSADTYRMVKSHGWEIAHPDKGFYQWIKIHGFIPTRYNRWCCQIFKESVGDKYLNKHGIDRAVTFMGIRNEESVSRADRQDFWQSPHEKESELWRCYPIHKFSELMVWIYILKYGIEINPKYRKGYQRVGCAVVCPYATKYQWALDEYWYPKQRERWKEILRDSFQNKQWWCSMNCTTEEFVTRCWNGGLYRKTPNDEVVNEFMRYKNLDSRDVALQYFNKQCCMCGKNVRNKDVIAMNLKLHSRDAEKIYCKKHLKELHNMDNSEWNRNIENFKKQKCNLF